MTSYVLRRLLQAIPTLLGITMLSFALVHAAPGDPITLLTFDPSVKASDREALREQLCLDRPVYEQYAIWIVGDWKGKCRSRGLIRGDFGTSFFDKRPVLEMILERIPATLELTVTAMIFGVIIGVAVGVNSAIHHGKAFDNLSRFFAVVGNAIPSFWLGLLMIMVFSVWLGWLPVGGRHTLNVGEPTLPDRLRHLIMPAFVLSVGWVAVLSRYMRTQTLEVIKQDYVRTAFAKGVSKRRVHFWHVFRNALIPLVTILGPAIGGLLGGAVIIEQIFSWPGMGRLAIGAVFQRDYPLLMANVVIGSMLVMGGNLLSDMLYAVVDPRIRLR